ncbi:MAG TPA: homoserine kinase [Caulobacteraceae bacterium]|jgi:homoserine kinase type II|nr:homoserine kinase [Caulobacteraceae bacterium]
MAVYTEVSDSELEAFLAGYDLGRPLSFKGVAEGVENSNYLLETEAGRFILTLYERRVKAADLPFFLSLLTWLADHGFPSARPVADHTGQSLGELAGRPAAIVTFVSGLSARRPGANHCCEAGEGLAWLHQASMGFSGHRANDLGQRAWAGLAAGLSDRAEALKPGLAATIASDLDELAEAWPKDLPEGVVHADWFPDNVFFRDGRFAGAIDFYFAADDLLAYDLGVALNAWCFEADGSFNVTSAGALIEGYERRRTLTAGERAALPALARGAAMRFFLTRLADWRDDRAAALVRPKDPLEYERKLAVHRAGLKLFTPK